MKKFFDEENPLVIAVKKILDLIVVNFLWVLTSIPLFTLGMTLTALYDVVYKDIWHGRGTAILDYFSACKKNFRQALPAGALIVALAVLMGIDIWLFRGMAEDGFLFGYLWILVAVLLAILVVYLIWLTAEIARFRAPLKTLMKNALMLTIRHLPVSIVLLILTGAAVLGIWIYPSWMFMVPAVAMFAACFLIEKVFRLYMTEEERQHEDELNDSWTLYRKKKKRGNPD